MSGKSDTDKLSIPHDKTTTLPKINVNSPRVKILVGMFFWIYFYFDELFFLKLIDISKLQHDEFGDGTISVVVLVSQLLQVFF